MAWANSSELLFTRSSGIGRRRIGGKFSGLCSATKVRPHRQQRLTEPINSSPQWEQMTLGTLLVSYRGSSPQLWIVMAGLPGEPAPAAISRPVWRHLTEELHPGRFFCAAAGHNGAHEYEPKNHFGKKRLREDVAGCCRLLRCRANRFGER
jgi:hypothetical protein